MKYNLEKIKQCINTANELGCILEWIEGFKQELKDVLKQEVYGDQLYYRICDSCVMRNSCLEYGLECEALQKLKEILGES